MIQCKQVGTGYGKRPVLRDVSVTFEKGMLTSIIGVNGSGKSTLIKASLGLLPLWQGEIVLDGQPLGNLSRGEIARKAAYLSQGKSTPDMTVEQLVLHGRFPHLKYPRRYSREDWALAYEAMNQVGLAPLAQRPLDTLSGGMRQKAYIAMALAQGTDYILLDEPTTYLDIRYQLELMQTLRALADQGKGVVAVMHDLPMACTFSHRMILLQEGAVVQVGTPEELLGAIDRAFGVSLERWADGRGYAYRLPPPG